ncbi:hypothetical protein VP01_4890g1 [Puccinia sorghi]|uniref:Uncharacterized protein n=1 Tax=Puccinia sorghi TaxID=27349 RepID=A0A0L6UMX7_9BASI|nr:hypothetical protein VP01_4890g1 [Puccinia sorghi]
MKTKPTTPKQKMNQFNQTNQPPTISQTTFSDHCRIGQHLVESQSQSGIKAATHLNTFSRFVRIHQKIFVHLPQPSSITLLSSILIIGPSKLLNQITLDFYVYSGKQFLAYPDNKFWWAPQVINLDLAKKEVLATKPILPLHQRSPHIKSNLFRVLGSVINPPPS